MHRKLLRYWFLFPLVCLAACGTPITVTVVGPTATISATATTAPPSASIKQITAFTTAADTGTTTGITAAATCPTGLTLVSGGYSITGPKNPELTSILSSYPSNASTWTVTIISVGNGGAVLPGPFTVTTYADCLQANFPVTSQIVSKTQLVSPTQSDFDLIKTSCPATTSFTGFGFQTTNSPTEPVKPQVVSAICVTSDHLVSSLASADAPVPTTPVTATVACPTNQLLVGGAFSFFQTIVNAYGNFPTSDDSKWQVQLGQYGVYGGGTPPGGTIYALCAQVK